MVLAKSSIQELLLKYRPSTNSLKGKVVLVTGANRGLGRAVSRAAADAGAETIVLGRNVKELERLADEIENAGLTAPSVIPADLEGATVDDYAMLAELIHERYGRLDGLVLNAGILGEMAPLASYDPVTWARVFQVNVHSQFLLVQATLPLLQHGNSSIIFTSSGVGRKSRAYWGAYAAAKFATEGMMQTLADELADQNKVRVNAINPGRLRTKMRAEAYPAEDPLTLLRPAEITHAYLFLLGADGRDAHGLSLDAQLPK